jgi:hypothetical protein
LLNSSSSGILPHHAEVIIMNNSQLETKVLELEAKIEELEKTITNLPKARDRGPTSDRPMTEDDARRVLMGDLKDAPHKKAAEELGLSYGQVYSCRGGYTFKAIFKESEKAKA